MHSKTMALVVVAMFVGCSSDSETSTDAQNQNDARVDSPQIDQKTDPEADQQIDQSEDSAPDVTASDGKATEVQLHLHDNEVKIVLATLKVVGKEATTFDLYMAHDDGPNMYLGEGVTAQNLGSAKGFHEIDEAPDTGYEEDGDALIIGTSYRNGGEGTTGYIMTDNIYVLKLADGTYAKIQVLSAKQGTVPVLCYRQADGSRDLKTEQ